MILVTAVLILSSCSSTAPQIIQTSAQVIFDYADAESAPDVRFSVFVKSDDNVRRFSTMTVGYPASGYEWKITEPELIASSDGEWAGWSKIEPRDSESIPQGTYTLDCTDAYGNETRTEFTMAYPEDLIRSRARDIPALLGNGSTEKFAVYSAGKTLLYYGPRKKGWTDTGKIWQDYKEGDSFRRCWTTSSDTVVCILPPVMRLSDTKTEKK
ncbi:MAG: hypothetical protein LKF96_08965 [Treponema sp.]|jgi:hypothetical protein|nr:hypothetical protein [Treponema sp.]